MSDGYAVSGAGDFAVPEKRAVRKDKGKILKILTAVLAVLIAVLAVVYCAILPCAVPAQIRFNGLKTLHSDTLRTDMRLTDGKTWLAFDTAAAARALSANIVIEDSVIEKRFPDQIIITVTERQPAAVALVHDGSRTIPVQIDRNGVIFRVNEGMPATTVPIISGLTFEQPRTGVRLHAKLRPLLERLMEIQKNSPVYFAAISEIQIAAKEYGNYDLIVYPMSSRTKVLVDRTLNDSALNYMIVALDVLNSLQTHISEVDLRGGAISFKTADGGML